MTDFSLDNIKVLHIESTTVCNAACPQCSRENPNKYNDLLNRNTLTVEKIKELFSPTFIKQLDKMFMCGNYGDPAASYESLNIFRYFRDINPNITLGLNTNGGAQNTNFWSSLGELLSKEKDYCVFSIDGLEDTNDIYRVNVRWSKVIENARAFISAGGHAQWDMLIFEHNQHQINDAKKLSYDLGFTHFRAKVSKRFEYIPVDNLNPPTGFKLPNVRNPKEIVCHANKEKSLYVAANGTIYPCCWIGDFAYAMDQDLNKLLDPPNYLNLINSWSDRPHRVCTDNCGITNSSSTFEQQWVVEEVFK